MRFYDQGQGRLLKTLSGIPGVQNKNDQSADYWKMSNIHNWRESLFWMFLIILKKETTYWLLSMIVEIWSFSKTLCWHSIYTRQIFCALSIKIPVFFRFTAFHWHKLYSCTFHSSTIFSQSVHWCYTAVTSVHKRMLFVVPKKRTYLWMTPWYPNLWHWKGDVIQTQHQISDI